MCLRDGRLRLAASAPKTCVVRTSTGATTAKVLCAAFASESAVLVAYGTDDADPLFAQVAVVGSDGLLVAEALVGQASRMRAGGAAVDSMMVRVRSSPLRVGRCAVLLRTSARAFSHRTLSFLSHFRRVPALLSTDEPGGSSAGIVS